MPASNRIAVSNESRNDHGTEYLGTDKHRNSIQAVKLADFIIQDQNPMDDIRNSETVMFAITNGVVLGADTLNEPWPEALDRGRFHLQK